MTQKKGIKIRLTIPKRIALFDSLPRIPSLRKRRPTTGLPSIRTKFWQRRRFKVGTLAVTGGIVLAQVAVTLSPFLVQTTYALGSAESLLTDKEPTMAANLTFDTQQQMFSFNNKRSMQVGTINGNSGGVTATAYTDISKGLSVSDSTNNTNFKLTPKFRAAAGQQDGNRIVYPLIDHDGWAVYTMTSIGTKEDIVLKSSNKDSLSFEYEMSLADGLEPRIEADGGIGIYGNKLFSGNISAGSDKDAELLKKARQNSLKDSLIFTIPAPITVESDNKHSGIRTYYKLDGNKLTVNVDGLKKGNYPLSIDPSIYVSSAAQFMYGNNETNVNFDVANQLIKKGRTSGARFNSWQSTTNLPQGYFGGGAVAAGGYLYQVGGNSVSGNGTTITTTGTSNYVVPQNIYSIDVKMWGGGGGGANASTGGGAGFAGSTLAVTPGETLTINVGGGGGGGAGASNGASAGGGGGYSGISRSGTPLLIAAGGGGGASRASTGSGGPGGCTSSGTSCNGTATGTYYGRGASSSAAGTGTVGYITCGTNNDGSSFQGGRGATLTFNACTAGGGGGTGGASGGGQGGGTYAFGYWFDGGGGGGGGRYGGAGGGAGDPNTTSAGGGGGGSSYATGTNQTLTGGTGSTPGNNSDPARGSAGNGGSLVTAGTNGIVIIDDGQSANASVYWAQFDTGNGTVVNANPGSGTCSSWCSSTIYNLPDKRSNLSVVAYNGYLYAMGGNDMDGPNVSNHKFDTVYVAKLGANGEPRLWHPTDTDKSNWVYWYHDDSGMTLPEERAFGSAVAYNNKMYFIGGVDNSSAVGAATSTVWVADILPNGKLGSWSTSTTLSSGGPGATYGATTLAYNDRLYLLGGAGSVAGSPFTSNAYYINIKGDGTLDSSWVHTNDFATGRVTNGGVNATVWGGYVYISGGCGATNSDNFCTSVLSDTQIASINADGSLGTWRTMSGVTKQTMGANLITWRDAIYSVGGCASQSLTTGGCTGGVTYGITYSPINAQGSISAMTTSSANGVSTCTGGTPTNCDLPATASVGNFGGASVVNNGYLYYVGGCTNVACSTTSTGAAFTQVTANGDLVRPSSCPAGSTATNGWCVMNTALPAGVALAGVTVFNDTIYLVGGTNGSALTNSIYRATVAPSTGLLSAWTSSSLSGAGATSVVSAYATSRANPASASTSPGNMYIFGGCVNNGCTGNGATTTAVYKCNIGTTGAVSGCSTSGQLQLPTNGLAHMGGATYANYIYLVGGYNRISSGVVGVSYTTVLHAKFDNSNNVVTAGSSGWTTSTATLSRGLYQVGVFIHNGYLYVIGGLHYTYPSTANMTNTVQQVKINPTDGSLDSSFTTSDLTLSSNRYGTAVPVSNSRAYIIGGCTAISSGCSTATATIQSFRIYNNDSGAPASYAQSNNTGTDVVGAGSVILNGYIYQAGGCTALDCSTTSSTTYYAPINPDGTIGTWSTGGSLPAGSGWGKLVTAGGALYYIGGQTGSATSSAVGNIYYTSGINNGNPTWSGSAATKGIGDTGSGSQKRTMFSATVWNNRIYVAGGSNDAGTLQNTVYVSPQLNSGGDITSNWTSSTAFNVARKGLGIVAYANNLYLVGGDDGTYYLSDVQFSKINTSDGTVGSWSYANSLPRSISGGGVFAANGYLYVVGGRSAASTCSQSTLVAPISSNTTVASGNNPTGIGKWDETSQKFGGARYGNSVSYNDGKLHILGGGCTSLIGTGTGVTNDRAYTTALLVQPQIAKYSISFDTDTNVYPQKFLVNGIDNSIGAQWQMKYRTMSDPSAVTNLGTGVDCSASPMTGLGQQTNYGGLTLGSLGAYTARDDSGNDMSCGRYYYVSLAIDAQNSFGFPDDDSRGPTITDVSLRYTANPAKRLMHGRTFIGGQATPLDTPDSAN